MAAEGGANAISLAGRAALVTGGSRGIGAAIARHFAGCGADLAIVYRASREEAEEVVAGARSLGRRAHAIKADAERPAECAEAAAEAIRLLGGIDILVNNVAISDNTPFLALEPAQWERAVAVNVGSLYPFTRAALEGMRERRYGRILNIGSICGVRPVAAVPVHYATTKAAMQAFTWTLAREVARYGITVNCLAPGLVDTDFAAGLPEERIRDFERFCPMGRAGTPEEIARVAAFLVCDQNSYMTGETVVVGGGL